MDNDKYSRKVSLHCPTCGNTKFEFDDNVDPSIKSIRCPSCNREFSKDELIRENSRVINNNVEEVKKEVLNDVKKEFQNMFKKFK